MKLTLPERLILSRALLPNKGDDLELTLRRDIIKKTEISQDEYDKYEIKIAGNGMTWNDEGTKAIFDIEFTNAEKKRVATVLNEMKDKKELSDDILDMFYKFTQEEAEKADKKKQ